MRKGSPKGFQLYNVPGPAKRIWGEMSGEWVHLWDGGLDGEEASEELSRARNVGYDLHPNLGAAYMRICECKNSFSGTHKMYAPYSMSYFSIKM